MQSSKPTLRINMKNLQHNFEELKKACERIQIDLILMKTIFLSYDLFTGFDLIHKEYSHIISVISN